MGDISFQKVLNQRNNYNLAIPFVETQQTTPFHKMSVSLLYVDTDEKALQIFKSGSRSLGNDRWEPLYSLAKPFLERLATEAGIQFNPGCGDVVKMDENTWKASAAGGIRLPDGNIRTANDFKVIDLATEEKKYRLAYEEKAENGIRDYRAATEAAKKYKGQWVDTGQKDTKGFPIRLYIIAEQERSRYIEGSLLDAMTQLRANAPQKAATGAKLRVIRALLGIKGSYTMDELKKPFAVARTSFSPDYNDPAVRQMLLQQAVQSIGNIFGNMQPVVQTISVPWAGDAQDLPDGEEDMEPAVEILPGRMQEETAGNWWEQDPASALENMPEQEDRTMDFRCDKCGEVIPRKVWDYSMEHDGRPLCYRCQKIVRSGEKGGWM